MNSINTDGWLRVTSEVGNGLTKVLSAQDISDALRLSDIAMRVIKEQGYLQHAMLTVNRHECIVALLEPESPDVPVTIEQVASLIDRAAV